MPRRRSVTASVVPPVVTHCFENPDVDSAVAGSGVSEEM